MGLRRRSERRDERLARIGARGPLCEEAKRSRCAYCGRLPTDPAHIDRVGKGYGDWVWRPALGRWVGRVAALCRSCHNIYDRNVLHWGPWLEEQRVRIEAVALVDAERRGEEWAQEVGVSLTAGWHFRPYELWHVMGQPGPGDIE